ncbi:MAG: hypothetical protein ACREYC_25210 [Gammaproteobacteria bacterium]
MGEDLGNHGGVYDGGDDPQGAATMGAVLARVECKPFVGNGGAGDVAAQVLRPRRAKQGHPWPWLPSFFL